MSEMAILPVLFSAIEGTYVVGANLGAGDVVVLDHIEGLRRVGSREGVD